MEAYIPRPVQQVRAFYGDLWTRRFDFPCVGAHLEALSEHLFKGIESGDERVHVLLSNFHPDFIGTPFIPERLRSLKTDDARLVHSKEFGFSLMVAACDCRYEYDPEFEAAVDAVIWGKADELRDLLKSHPELVEEHSPYGHRATLLHYVSSNGVEVIRQQVPANLVEIAEILIENGADKGATMRVYGGDHTPLQLLRTSAHPKAAGLLHEAESVLR
ncbi:MAG: hypothetical protein J4F31_00845 [Flavobacteriales bacterium]|nr:hypothetical protein [Flavobacteriales bacterium]